ncbi:MAG: low molecular weight protein-tyrosine-phosphatase [Pseudomonadota bacterium]
MSVLCVCLGNICRSPAAEGVLKAVANRRGVDIVVDSAGTGAWHAGEPPDPRMQAAAARRGYNLSGQRARKATPADFQKFAFIYAMDQSNLNDLQAIAPASHDTVLARFLGDADVPDPYYGADDGFDHVLTLIEGAAGTILDRIAVMGEK